MPHAPRAIDPGPAHKRSADYSDPMPLRGVAHDAIIPQEQRGAKRVSKAARGHGERRCPGPALRGVPKAFSWDAVIPVFSTPGQVPATGPKARAVLLPECAAGARLDTSAEPVGELDRLHRVARSLTGPAPCAATPLRNLQPSPIPGETNPSTWG